MPVTTRPPHRRVPHHTSSHHTSSQRPSLITQVWDLTKPHEYQASEIGAIQEDNAFQIMHSLVKPVVQWAQPPVAEPLQGEDVLADGATTSPTKRRRGLIAVGGPNTGWLRRALAV